MGGLDREVLVICRWKAKGLNTFERYGPYEYARDAKTSDEAMKDNVMQYLLQKKQQQTSYPFRVYCPNKQPSQPSQLILDNQPSQMQPSQPSQLFRNEQPSQTQPSQPSQLCILDNQPSQTQPSQPSQLCIVDKEY